MKRMYWMLAALLLMLQTNFVFAGMPDLKLPFPGGESWRVSCAYRDTDPGCTTHRQGIKDEYALDFNWGNQSYSDCGKFIVAVANGNVAYAGWYSGYGWTVDIDHGSYYQTRYAHLQSMSVAVGDSVTQGQKIGECGSSGGDWSCHLHFVLYHNDWSTPPEPMSGHMGFVHGGGPYLSNNYPNHSILKFTDSPKCYLYSNSQLWPIFNESTFVLLGFSTYKCSSTADFSGLIELDPSQRSGFTIRDYDQIPSQGLVVKIVDKIGPNTCSQRDGWRDPASIYMFDCDRFRPIASAQVYYDLGFSSDWSDVVEITQDLFDEYGDGYTIFNPDHVWCGGFGGGGGDYEDCISAPYNLTAEAISTSQIKLQMSMSDICTNFEIRIYKDGQAITKFPGTHGTNAITISGLQPYTNYCFQAKTVVVKNGVSYESDYSNTACATTQANPPTANFTASPTSGDAPLAVSFTDTSSGEITSYHWDFGDGQTSTSKNTSHTFVFPGYYATTHTVTGPGGLSTKTITISVQQPIPPSPAADFTADPANGEAPLTVQFTNTSTGEINSWNWDFGDGQTSAEHNPEHIYNTSGIYEAKLTVANPGGSSAKTIVITVQEPSPPESAPDAPTELRIVDQ